MRWAAERTLLAWIRTALALFGLGFVLARFVMTVDVASIAAHPATHAAELPSRALGIAFVLIGTGSTAAASLRYRDFLHEAAPAGAASTGSNLAFVTSALVSLLGLLLALTLVFSFP